MIGIMKTVAGVVNKMEIDAVITMQSKPNSMSFRWGGTGTDMKIYFDDAEDLEQQLNSLETKTLSIKNKIQNIRSGMNE